MPNMLGARLHGPRDLRVDSIPIPGSPGPGEVLLRVRAVGICGSDLHTFADGRIGDQVVPAPLVLGHEFAGEVEAVGADAVDGAGVPLTVGARVAVDPAQPCHRCELCEHGHPNLCARLHFCGLWPDSGSLCEWLVVPARTCFVVPSAMSASTAALLEPLGVAIHAVDLAAPKLGDTAVVLGAGPIGLLILQCLRHAGAQRVFVTDRLAWRLEAAERLGGTPIDVGTTDPVRAVESATGGRGVDVAVEAAWCDETVEQAAAMARLGGLVVLVGISGDDTIRLKHSTARRKGLTLKLSRRMKHVYPRAIELVDNRCIDVDGLVSHRAPLTDAPRAFALNAAYQDRVIKIVIDV